jgi:glycosyltransferase involved in cell wall biosynthesis
VLKVLHITESHSAAAGGVTTVVNHITSFLLDNGFQTEIIASENEQVIAPLGVKITVHKSQGIGHYWNWSNKLNDFIRERIEKFQPNIIHLHGAWMAPQWYGAKIANELGIKTIFSPHGMLEPWSWNNQGLVQKLKKKLYWRFVSYPIFKKVSLIHAITPLELENLSQLFPKQQIKIIPNAINISQIKNYNNEIAPIILYIGRIHPVKGIELLINAFSEARLDKKWKLLIAGPIEVPSYMEKLKAIIKNNKLKNKVEFIGGIYDADKWQLLAKAWIVVVPSYLEVMGMVNIEAAACQTPTITTYQTGLSDWHEGGGILIQPEIAALTEALSQVCSWNMIERLKRGEMIRTFIESRYDIKVVGKQWLSIYKHLIN